jgi:hypothetical protein
LHNRDGQDARPTTNVLDGNLQVKCATAYQARQENKEKLNSHKIFVTQIRFLCVKKFKVSALVITQPIL